MSTPFARGPLLILLGALCFSTTGTVQALSPEGATPYVIGALRMLVGGLALLLWCAFQGELPRFWRWPMRCVVPSTLALLGFQFFFFRGVLEAGVAVGTVVAIGFSPIVVALLGLIFLREKPAKMCIRDSRACKPGPFRVFLRGPVRREPEGTWSRGASRPGIRLRTASRHGKRWKKRCGL